MIRDTGATQRAERSVRGVTLDAGATSDGSAFGGHARLVTRMVGFEKRENARSRGRERELGPGRALPAATRSEWSSAFGDPLDDVRVHTDGAAGHLARSERARAVTVGRDIAFAPGEYRPDTLFGRAVLAHEVAHAVQQRDAAPGVGAERSQAPTLERDADAAAAHALRVPGATAPMRRTSGLRLARCEGCSSETVKEAKQKNVPDPRAHATFESWLAAFPADTNVGSTDDVTGLVPPAFRDLVRPAGGPVADCADVSLLLRHYWLLAHGERFEFVAGPKRESFALGKGVSESEAKRLTIRLGTINFQEDRGGGFRLVDFYKASGKRLTNLQDLIAAGLEAGDLFVWKRLASVSSSSFNGHVQTVQSVDTEAKTVTWIQGNMASGAPVGRVEQRTWSFEQLTGRKDGNADIKDLSEESFFGAGPWRG